MLDGSLSPGYSTPLYSFSLRQVILGQGYASIYSKNFLARDIGSCFAFELVVVVVVVWF